jgi:hypothetical protein
MKKTFYPIRGFRITADSCGTANQKTLSIATDMEVTIDESKNIMAGIGEAIGWLKTQ